MSRRSKHILTAMAFPLLVALVAVPRAATRSSDVRLIPPTLNELLSGIDYVATRDDFDELSVTGEQLITIARDAGEDPGRRIRAYRALSLYPGNETEKALSDAIDQHGSVADGIDTVYVRAAMASLAILAGDRGVSHITPLLTHPSRDVRAAAASALAICGATSAASVIPLLRERVNDPDEVAQVKTACIDAIRALTEYL